VAAWPAFSAAVVAGATSLGYAVIEGAREAFDSPTKDATKRVELEIPNSEIVTGQLGYDQRISVARDGITVTFSRDARGKVSLCVTGEGNPKATLQALGEELAQRVVQQYVYQRLLDEIRARGYVIVEEERAANEAIRLKVRHWEN